MWVVFTNDVTHHTRGLLVRLVVVITKLAHREEDAAVDGLKTIPDVGQRAAHDDAHRIIEVGLLHLVFEAYRQQFPGNFSHTLCVP